MPDPSVQPPEGLRRLISKALFVVDWDIEPGTRGAYDKRADAVLAALFDACEVRERWGTRWMSVDGEERTAWWTSRDEAEASRRGCTCGARERDWLTPTAQLLRRCDLQTPPEPEINTW